MRRGLTIIEWLVIIGVIALLISIFHPMSGAPAWVYVLFGWMGHISHVIRTADVNRGALLSNAVWIALFTVGFHLFARWLYRELRKTDGPVARWRIRWTVGVVMLVFVSFATGTAAVGVLHQSLFLARSEEPMYAYRDRSPRLDSKEELQGYCEAHVDLVFEMEGGFDRWYRSPQHERDPWYNPERHNHILGVRNGEGVVTAVLVFHRDPQVRERVGIGVVSADGVGIEPAAELERLVAEWREKHPTTRPATRRAPERPVHGLEERG